MSQQPVQYQQVPAPQKTNTMAIVGFILAFFFSIVGGILGVIALGQIKNSGGREGGRGLAIAAVIIGLILPLVAVVVIVILSLLGPAFGNVFESINASLSGM
jgi:Flp pilus assembly pilin Flp